MASLGFRVYGDPVSQGSKIPGRNSKTGKLFVREQSGKKLKDWRDDIMEAAVLAFGDAEIITGEAVLRVIFWVPRPPSVPVKKRPYPTVAPDLDKMVRAVGDALEACGVVKNDAQFINIHAAKLYATSDDPPGAWIVIATPDTLPSTQV